MNSTASAASRQRGTSLSAADGEAMDVVRGEDEVEGDDDDDGQGEVEERSELRAPVRLLGRGGFTHPRRSRGSARGRESGRVEAPPPLPADQADQPVSQPKTAADPMDSLASSMSALQFVPHSVYSRGGRGRGRGG